MKVTAALALMLSLVGGTLAAQSATVRALLTKDLAGAADREVSMFMVKQQGAPILVPVK